MIRVCMHQPYTINFKYKGKHNEKEELFLYFMHNNRINDFYCRV
jgi:hypothetical protein